MTITIATIIITVMMIVVIVVKIIIIIMAMLILLLRMTMLAITVVKVVIIIIIIVMVLLINNSCDSDFDSHFLNCYFLKFSCMIEIFFFHVHHLIFNLLGIELHGFSRFDTLSLMTRVTSLKKLTYFF